MPEIAIVYHSGYGHTQRQAQAVAEGSGGRLLAIDPDGELQRGGWDELAAADAIVLGCPTYMGGPSWQFKKFADASSKPFYAQAWKDKLFAGFTNSGSPSGDKVATLQYLFLLAMQHGGLWVGPAVMPSNTKAAQPGDPNWLGVWAGAAAASPVDASAGEMRPGDLEGARAFGRRVAEAAARWAGRQSVD